MSDTPETAPVAIVGAGLAGLTCARTLQRAGVPWVLFEREQRVGGRVRTDEQDGFLLDRGFQVFLTSYPEASRQLDLDALDLRAFYPGALVRIGGERIRLANPRRRPWDALGGIDSRVFTIRDALRVSRLLLGGRKSASASAPTRERLRELGFSPASIEHFFRPFFGGVFLESELDTPAVMFEFVFRMFAAGRATLPARGMQAIPDQLAAGLPAERLRLGRHVDAVGPEQVVLRDGETVAARATVVAADARQANRLLGRPGEPAWSSGTTLYFSAPRSPLRQPILMLDGDGEGLVNHVCVPSDVAPGYAPADRALISVTLIGLHDAGDPALAGRVRNELVDWFGDEAGAWRHLRTYAIPWALPRGFAEGEPRVSAGLYVCGDHVENPSINGAMASGRRAAEAVLRDLGHEVART